MAKKALGKGLDALFFDNSAEVSSGGIDIIKIGEIEPNRNQPRKIFEDEALTQLAESIREQGIIQPLLVRPLSKGGYQIIAGERRWRASRMAGLTEVPVIIKDIDDVKTMELALIENLQRENLNAIEEALGYQELMNEYKFTQADVSKSVGKSRSAIANMLRLLNLPKIVIDYIKSGELSPGTARALLQIEDEKKLIELAERAVKQSLSARDVEKLAKMLSEEKKKKEVMVKSVDTFFTEAEISLKSELNRKVKINVGSKGKGVLELSFYDKEDLKHIIQLLSKE